MKNASKYKVHRTLAIIAVPLLLISTTSGFLRANQKWFWEDGYKKKKEPARFAMEHDLAPLPVIVHKIDSITGADWVDPKSIVQIGNGSYLNTATNILTMANGTKINTINGLIV